MLATASLITYQLFWAPLFKCSFNYLVVCFFSSVLCVFLLLWGFVFFFFFAYLVVVYFIYFTFHVAYNHLNLFLFSGVSYEGINTSCGSVGENCSLSQHHCHYDYRWPADYCYRKSRGANMSLGSFIRIKGLFLPNWWIEVLPFTINSGIL